MIGLSSGKEQKTLQYFEKYQCRLLKPGMTVLDIGYGWGGFAKWAAKKYDSLPLLVPIKRRNSMTGTIKSVGSRKSWIIKELLGHKSISMTERYAHLMPSVKRKAVTKLADNFQLHTTKANATEVIEINNSK